MTAERQVVVLGAGAAGLMAGIRAARCGAKTLVLEKNPRPGIKILMSGGTRCNITHDCDNRGIIEAYGPAGKFLHSALAAFSVQDTLDFFHAGGVPTKVEGPGKVFPVSDRATDVLGALLDALRESGADLALSEPASGVQRRDDGRFDIVTPRRTVTARAVIVTTGGLSYPGSGTTGDGYAVARQFGHTIVPPRPALTPITSPAAWVAGLRGITLPDVTLTLTGATPKPATRRGSLLFAHFGLTGPVALDLSRFISGHATPALLTLTADLMPDSTAEQLDVWLQQQSLDAGRKLLANVLAERLPHRLAEVALEQAGLAADRRAAGLAKADRRRVVELLKRLPIPVSGTLGFAKAEVTAGGVDLREVHSKSLESKRAAGLYFAGEVLDLDGPIGGYNFQAAWSTGWLAGQSAASRT
jgi:predicted Rossmann fold flavoprotein